MRPDSTLFLAVVAVLVMAGVALPATASRPQCPSGNPDPVVPNHFNCQGGPNANFVVPIPADAIHSKVRLTVCVSSGQHVHALLRLLYAMPPPVDPSLGPAPLEAFRVLNAGECGDLSCDPPFCHPEGAQDPVNMVANAATNAMGMYVAGNQWLVQVDGTSPTDEFSIRLRVHHTLLPL